METFQKLLMIFTSIHLFGIVGSESKWMRNPYCVAFECCNSDWIVRDVEALKRNLTDQLFGQHIVRDAVASSLTSHVKYGSDKPLVFSFHGSTGVGKSFVSKLIANSWFRKGMDSSYAHLRIGSKDFPYKDRIRKYKEHLEILIRGNTLKCPHQVFIFDEVDMFPPSLLDTLTPYLTSYEKIEGVDYRKCIFILISNTGQKSINNKTFATFKSGSLRESLALKEMEEFMTEEIYTSKDTGLSHSQLIDRYFISYSLPFLPLERKHVRMCVERSFKNRLQDRSISTELIDDVMAELLFHGPEEEFATKGCKNVDEKVNYVLGQDMYKSSRTDL